MAFFQTVIEAALVNDLHCIHMFTNIFGKSYLLHVLNGDFMNTFNAKQKDGNSISITRQHFALRCNLL